MSTIYFINLLRSLRLCTSKLKPGSWSIYDSQNVLKYWHLKMHFVSCQIKLELHILLLFPFCSAQINFRLDAAKMQFTVSIRTAERKAPSITKHNWRRTKQNKTGDDLKIKLVTNAKTCPVRRILVNLVNMTNWSFFSKQNIYSSSSFNIVVKLCQFSSHSSRTALGLLTWCRRVGGRFIHF